MTKRILLTAVAAASLAAAEPALADRYVSPAGDDQRSCAAQLLPCKSVTRAVETASAGETIHVAPGLYAESVDVDKRVTIAGAGAGPLGQQPDYAEHTVIGAGDGPGIRMSEGGALRDLRALAGVGADWHADAPGLRLEADDASHVPQFDLQGVVALGALDVLGNRGAALIADGRMELGLRDSGFDQPTVGDGGAAPLLHLEAAGEIRTAGLTLAGAGPLVHLEGATDAAFDRLRSTRALVPGGITAAAGATVRLSRTRIVARYAAVALHAPNGDVTTRGEVRDSVLASTGLHDNGAAVTVAAGDSGRSRAELLLSGSTVAIHSAQPWAAVSATARSPEGAAVVTAENSVLRATDTFGTSLDTDVRVDAGAVSTVTFAATHSSYSDVFAHGAGATATPAGTNGNVAGDPGFTDEAAGDFMPAAGSALLDAGDPARASATDLDGTPRPLDGDGRCGAQPDIGAHERAAAPDAGCPQPPAPPQPPAAEPGDATAPRLSGLRRTGKRVRFTLSEPAHVELALQRCARVKGKRCRRWSRATVTAFDAPAGTTSRRVASRRGRYRVTLRAVDGAGNRSRAAALKLRITR